MDIYNQRGAVVGIQATARAVNLIIDIIISVWRVVDTCWYALAEVVMLSRVDSILVDVRDEAQLRRLVSAGASIFEVYEPSGKRGVSAQTLRTQLLRIPFDLAVELGIIKRLATARKE